MYPERNRDSLLKLLLERGLQDQFPDLIDRLGVEDITIPNLRRELRWLDVLEQTVETQKKRSRWTRYTTEKRPKLSLTQRLYGNNPPDDLTKAEQRLLSWIDREYKCPIPPQLDSEFKDVTALEASMAYGLYHAIGASPADNKEFSELIDWTQQNAVKLGLETPRIIVMESDLPELSVLTLPRMGPTIFMSRNIVEIMDMDALKACIGHELDHSIEKQEIQKAMQQPETLRKRFTNLVTSILHSAMDGGPYQEEYSADIQGAKLTSVDDMNRGLLAMYARQSELSSFSKRIQQVLAEEKVTTKYLPFFLTSFAEYEATRYNRTDKNRLSHLGNSKKDDTHPPMQWRFDNLNDMDERGVFKDETLRR